ncbi:hypothetical protein CC79DRAFT_817405 [Sarocladium strictum]
MSSSSSNSDYLQDKANCLTCFSLTETKNHTENASSTALVSHKAQAGPAATSFPFTKLPSELRIMIIEATPPNFFAENIRRIAINREWYPYALRHLFRNISISRMSDPFAFIGTHPQRANDEYFQYIMTSLARNLTHFTMDLDHMLRRYQFLPWDADTYECPDLAARRAIAALDPERESLKIYQKRPKKDPTSVEEATDMIRELIRGSVAYLWNVNSWDISIRESWGVHRNAISFLDHMFRVALSDLSRLRTVKLNSVKLDLADLARRDTQWARDEQDVVHDGLPFFWLDHELMEGVADDPRAAPAWEDNPHRAVLYDERHVCSGIQKILPHLEVLHIRTRSMCALMFRENGHELHGTYTTLWPFLAEDPNWEHLVPPRLDAFAPRPVETPLPKLKEVVINMIMPWLRYKNPRVVHCCTRDILLNHQADLKFSDLAYLVILTEVVNLTRRMTNPRKVVVRYAGVSTSDDTGMSYWEYDALANTERRISVDQWGEFVAYIGPVLHNAMDRHVPGWQPESPLNDHLYTNIKSDED